jgi:methyl-accepting chemotaxis protein
VAGTNQQQIGLEQVTLALKSINSATEQTAASVTHIDNSIGNISIISQELKKLVENYKKEMN